MNGLPAEVFPPKGSRIAVALSGGVDSAVTAFLLKQMGYSVAAVTLKLFCLDEEPAPADGDRSCCSLDAIADAAAVASRIGVPHHVWDFEEIFRASVVESFRSEYLAGRTPNPCVECNRKVRFRAMLAKVERAGYPYLATGHYARLVAGPDGVELHRAADPAKDQTYVLWGVPKSVLPRLVFPLGSRTKKEVRRVAAEAGLPVAEKAESQDICFLPDGDLARVLGELPEGEIRDGADRLVGRHGGAARYTVGQRRGLGLALGFPTYVTAVDVERNLVRIGEEEELLSSGLIADDANWLVPEKEIAGRPIEVKIRYRHRGARAEAVFLAGGAVEVRFASRERAVTPGQSAVFYDGKRLLGGAVIRAAIR